MREGMMQSLRVGIVGAGAWARQAHVPGFQECPGVELVAICDVDLARAEQAAREASIARVYRAASDMLAVERLDLVSVVTPDDCHLVDAGAAIAAGAHVLCEKPLATTLEDARALAALAAQAGILTKVGFAMRYSPAMAALRELVVTGALGEPRLLEAFQQNGQFLDPMAPFHWKMDRRRTGGGAIVEYGVHTIDLARWIVGEVSSVCAASRTWTAERPLADGAGIQPVDVDDSTGWLMEFASGAIGVCHAGWSIVGRPPGVEVRVFGSRGAARCLLSDNLPGAERLEVAGPDGAFRPAFIPAHHSALMPQDEPWWYRFPAHLIRRFVSEIRANQPESPSFEDGVRAQAVLDAILVSMRERRWVDVENM